MLPNHNHTNNQFKSAWWLRGPHLQTLWPALFRRKLKFPITNERFELPDGDFLDLAWVGHGDGPIVLVLHGLNGSVHSPYVNGILNTIYRRGWRGVCMHFRGCGGTPNRLARSYHSGETQDLNSVIAEIIAREPKTPLLAIGYSLGGNVLLKALGEGSLSSALRAAVAVSVPFELAKTARHLCRGFARVYQWKLVRGLRRVHKAKFGAIKKLKTFLEFDQEITAPLHGFKNAQDYYARSSSRQFLGNIKTPTLILHARNDPFTTIDSLPEALEVSHKVHLEYTENGGHVGFIAGKYPWKPIYWLEQRIMDYFHRIEI